MPDVGNIETTVPAPQNEGQDPASHDGSRWRAPSHNSRRAAAIEAAYILEAVRK
jgi:hypothetical protein